MAHKRKQAGETPEQAVSRKARELVSNCATRSEKVSWERKLKNLQQLMTQIDPISDQIVALLNERAPLLDQLAEIRSEMVATCVHPYEHLLYHDGSEQITCKFCDKTFKVAHEK